MKALLLIALVAGQYYEWIDQNGDSHFTDDVSTIPKGVKRRVIEGAEPVLTVTREPTDAGRAQPDAGVVKRPAPAPTRTGPDSCELAKKKIALLEAKVAQSKLNEDRERKPGKNCQAELAVRGQAAYALCMASQAPRDPAVLRAQTEKEEQAVEAAREELRRAQVEGCR